MEALLSIKDEKIRLARELCLPKVRRETGRVVLYGEEGVRWAKSPFCTPEYILCTRPLPQELFEFSEGAELFSVSEGISKKVSGTSQVIPYITVAKIAETEPDLSEPAVILDDVRDHGNIGTIIRTAAAFGFKNVILTNTANDIYYKNIVGASRGTALGIRYENIPAGRLAGFLKSSGYAVISTSSYGSVALGEAARKFSGKKTAVIFGNETVGVSKELLAASDAAVRIDLEPCVESLNVGVAAGIVLSALRASGR